jgi:hypothetical protein
LPRVGSLPGVKNRSRARLLARWSSAMNPAAAEHSTTATYNIPRPELDQGLELTTKLYETPKNIVEYPCRAPKQRKHRI